MVWSALGGALWLCLIGGLVWMHARESVWPPIYDAYTYFFKARSVWAAFAAHRFDPFDLMAIEPTFRPLGTILMSYPFGFTMDFRGFYFRSTFLPVALVCAAGFIGSWAPVRSRRSLAMAALTACFLSALSLFYDFELYAGGPPAISHWGLVDGFLTGLASVAMAAATRSVLRRSTGWAVLSTLVSFLVIYVKPSGLLIAAVCGAILAMGWLWRVKEDWSTPQRRATVRQALLVIAVEALLLGGGAAFALLSAYVSPENLMYGNAAIDVMRAELNIGWRTQFRIAKAGLGPFVLIWVVAMAWTWVVVRKRDRESGRRPRTGDETATTRADELLVLLGFMTLLGGLWFWIYGSGGRTLVRYFAPFLYVAIFSALPGLLKALEAAPPIARRSVGLLMVGTLLNLVALLSLPNPNLTWQMQSGVNVKSGTRPDSIAQAEALLGAPYAAGTTIINVYSCVEGVADAMFQSVFDLHALQVAVPRYNVRRPVDWQRPTAYRVEEILSSDYILSDPALTKGPLRASIPTFADEKVAINIWVSRLTRDDGVEPVSVRNDLVLLRIADRAKLRASIESFVAAHRWRDVFIAANTPKWWSDPQIQAASTPAATTVDDIDFSGLVDVRRAMVVADPGGAMELKVWFRPSAALTGDQWVMLVHMLDATRASLANHDIALGRVEEAPGDHPYILLHLKFVPPATMDAIAVGFYRGATLLKASKGDTDWGGARLILKLPRALP